jgi:RNA polymerase sigma factor (sigma-70 family)
MRIFFPLYAELLELSHNEWGAVSAMSGIATKKTRSDELLGVAHIERYEPLLHAYLLRRIKHPQDTRDFTQEIFTRFIRRCNDDPETVRDPLRFLFGIALNVVRESRYDTQHTRVTFDTVLAEDVEAIDPAQMPSRQTRESTAEQVEMHEDILNAISQLPKSYLAAWWFVDVEGMSYEEAARASGFARNTISAYVTNARAKLKLALQDYWQVRRNRSK